MFAFHGKINEEMNGREAGFFSRDIVTAKNGRWTFYEPTAILKPGDTLYYWTYVDYFDGIRKLGYPKDDQKFEVKGIQHLTLFLSLYAYNGFNIKNQFNIFKA